MNRTTIWSIGIGLVIIVGAAYFFTRPTVPTVPTATTATAPSVATTSPTLHVVAAESFWGSLLAQIGGKDVSVTTIVTDPNADPHDYEATANDARTIADADYVVVNGVGYDTWADKLLATGGKADRKVLKVADLVGKQPGDNPHLWYQPAYVNAAIAQMESDLIALDPTHAADYRANYAQLQQALAPYQSAINAIKQQDAGTKVAATEDIFVYLADAAGLDLVSPPAFIEAVADGNDPPAASVATFQDQLKSGQVKVLLYNEQTVTPLTTSIKQLATAQHIPVVGMTETVAPQNASFQDWMGAQVQALQAALTKS